MNVSQLSGNFIFDMDEVLVDISPEMYRLIRMHWYKYNRWFKDLGPLTDDQVESRKEFKLTNWLLKDDIKNWSKKRLKHAKNLLWKYMEQDVFSVNFYDYLEPTEFAKRTLMNKSFMDHVRVNKVYILSGCVNEEMVENKRKFIRKWFPHSKIEFLPVLYGQKKSDVVKEKNISWNIFIDDEIKNIRDFIENLNIEGKEFLIPYFGYNDMPPILDLLIREKGAVFNYYERI